MSKGAASQASGSGVMRFGMLRMFFSGLHMAGRRLVLIGGTAHRLVAFSLISLGIALTKFNHAPRVIRPQTRLYTYRSGVQLLPLVTFFGLVLGLVIIGQSVFLLNRIGARDMVGTLMVSVVVRELGPLIAAILVLTRAGTAAVIELGTSRALGEVEALEALVIDPIHYLVVPRMLAMALSVFALSIYLILATIASGYLFIFLQDIPLLPGEYLTQIAVALNLVDFVVLGLKTISFGALCAVITCYHGLARPMRLEEVSSATVRAIRQCVVCCLVIDALFIFVYLVL